MDHDGYNPTALIGTSLLHYEITAKLGEGGMGQVYRARDGKLGREVAIKVLPEAFLADAERLARFEREAQMLASLNHSNIGAIYGLEEIDGTRFLVLELIEGETLEELIEKGVALERTFEIAAQIALALESAHERGIVHRDLKPANVKVTPEGQVKVLDFGLAKAWAPEAEDLSNSPTLTLQMTQAVVILGTAAYMSPEQARGGPLDKRSDIFSFGCVLYEMLTGSRPFAGEHVSATLAAVLTQEPDWTRLPDAVPGAGEALLRRCLRKNPGRRLHDIADARIEIEELLERPYGTTASAELVVDTAASWRRWRRAAPWAVVALMAIVAAWAIWGTGSATSAAGGEAVSPSLSRFVIPTQPLAIGERVAALAISPDGRRIVYAAQDGEDSKLFLREIDSLVARPIAGSSNAVGPFLSPDGERVGFAANGHLNTVSIEGGPATPLQEAAVFLGADWGGDDTIVYGEWPTRHLWSIPASGGRARALTSPLADTRFYIEYAPSFVSGVRAIVFNNFNAFTAPGGPLVRLQELDSVEQRVLELEGSNVHYTATGHLVFANGGSLFAAPFDSDRLELTGGASAVLAGVLTNVYGAAQFDLSANGTLIYLAGDLQLAAHRLVWVDRSGASTPITQAARSFWGPRLSPDGSRVATWIADDQPQVWTYDLVRGGLSRVTSEGANFWSLWTPDSQGLAFAHRTAAGTGYLAFQLADPSAPQRELVGAEFAAIEQPLSWVGGGEQVIFQRGSDGEKGFDIWIVSLTGEADPQLLVGTLANEFQGLLSPDGRWLAYVSDESGRREVYVKSFPAADRTIPISTEGGEEPLWAANGRELFYRNSGRMMVVQVETEPDFEASRPELLFEDNYLPGTPYGRNYDIDRKGERFVMIESVEATATVTEIVVVQNWFEELKRRMPTGR